MMMISRRLVVREQVEIDTLRIEAVVIYWRELGNIRAALRRDHPEGVVGRGDPSGRKDGRVGAARPVRVPPVIVAVEDAPGPPQVVGLEQRQLAAAVVAATTASFHGNAGRRLSAENTVTTGYGEKFPRVAFARCPGVTLSTLSVRPMPFVVTVALCQTPSSV